MSVSYVFMPKCYQETLMCRNGSMPWMMRWMFSSHVKLEIFVPTSSGLLVVSYHWVFTMKHRPDGTVDKYKARLVHRGFTQTYDVDYWRHSHL